MGWDGDGVDWEMREMRAWEMREIRAWWENWWELDDEREHGEIDRVKEMKKNKVSCIILIEGWIIFFF